MIVKGYRDLRWQTARFDIDGHRNLTWTQAWNMLRQRAGGNVPAILRRALDEGVLDTDQPTERETDQ